MTTYGSVTAADTFFANDLTGTWAPYSASDKGKALAEATRLIDALPLAGEKYELAPQQELEFPRIFRMSNRIIYWDVHPVNGIVVPPDVLAAVYIQAKYLLDYRANVDDRGRMDRRGVSSVSTGGTSESYDRDRLSYDVDTGLVREASALMKKYLVWGA